MTASADRHPNSDACSGRARLPRCLLAGKPGRWPKIRSDLWSWSMASSTGVAGLSSVSNKIGDASISWTSPFDREIAGNSFWCSALSDFQTASALSPMSKPSIDVLRLPIEKRVEIAFKVAVARAIDERARLGLPVYIWRNNRVVKLFPNKTRNSKRRK